MVRLFSSSRVEINGNATFVSHTVIYSGIGQDLAIPESNLAGVDCSGMFRF
jgi:hypothetical protein